MPDNICRITDGRMIITLDPGWPEETMQSVAGVFGLDSLTLKMAFSGGPEFEANGIAWTVTENTQGLIELSRTIQSMEAQYHWKDEVVLTDDAWLDFPVYATGVQATYGVNRFKSRTVIETYEGSMLFWLPDRKNARRVYLAGTFNNWSTLKNPMVHVDSGWIATLKLEAGKHLYKFIVDGQWITDPSNELREDDGHGGFNSIFFVYNHCFELNFFMEARHVFVSGSFNGWREKELEMNRSKDGWRLPVYLREGTHAYKFIVDRKWITDPANPVIRPDGAGNLNSFISIGDTLYFHLAGFPEARQVVLAGNFNVWNEGELYLEQVPDGWDIPYVLAPGNYEYKFIVDGRWITDPSNPYTTGSGDYINSFLATDTSHFFLLPDFPQAREVIVTGTFNSWSEVDYRMVRQPDGSWIFPIHLDQGKHLYKFRVDGAWMIDPSNPLWEENEYGTGNSVLWIGP
ncbi:MAG: glycogen-binding domain-containing protein [Bacteroidales bacterium]|nr:glycogen-binding domain-containing protein [Bacteroidales bacterium]